MTGSFLGDLMQTIAERGRALIGPGRAVSPSPPQLLDLCEALLSSRGEASGVRLAQDIVTGWHALPEADRAPFLRGLATQFGPDLKRLERAIRHYQESPSPLLAAKLHAATEPRRQELMRRLNLAPGGTTALVRLRETLLAQTDAKADLAALDEDLTHLFTSWFNRGFLVLRAIDWTTPANILEKIIRYEAVHEIHDWNDLRRRLEPEDRRCFGFFHPQLVDEPLIFVEVALTRGIPDAIAPLLAEDRVPIRAAEATTAVFYSISNCQTGLRGISFGNFLIKHVVETLSREMPRLTQFVTLSPVPGFAAWLKRARNDTSDLLSPDDHASLATLDTPDWSASAESRKGLEPALLHAAAAYFLDAKDKRNRPVDAVARFHLGNGARLERLNPFGDLSAKGLKQAHGLMVNYLYRPDDIERNHEAFATHGEVVAAAAVQKWRTPPRRSLTDRLRDLTVPTPS
ncbi:MAG: malonyl-CoA decarboxylase [Elstera sp.]